MYGSKNWAMEAEDLAKVEKCGEDDGMKDVWSEMKRIGHWMCREQD